MNWQTSLAWMSSVALRSVPTAYHPRRPHPRSPPPPMPCPLPPSSSIVTQTPGAHSANGAQPCRLSCAPTFNLRVWLALEHKSIPYDTILIDLRNKPEWYKAMVPTTLVPAARINGELVYESRDILMVVARDPVLHDAFHVSAQKLEQAFPETPLLPPTDTPQHAAALAMMEGADAISKAGTSLLVNHAAVVMCSWAQGTRSWPVGATPARHKSQQRRNPPWSSSGLPLRRLLQPWRHSWASMRDHSSLGVLACSEGLHARYTHLLSCACFNVIPACTNAHRASLSMVDIMYVPTLERLGANLPQARGMDIRNHAAFPRVAAWFAALDALPAYARVRSDDVTLHLLLRRLFSMADATPPAVAPAVQEARRSVMRTVWCCCSILRTGRRQPSWRPIMSESSQTCCSTAAWCIALDPTTGATHHPCLVRSFCQYRC